jgi:ankyrin repeat protein
VECVESLIKAGADIHMLVTAQASYLQSLAEQVAAGEEVEEHVDGINSLMIAAAAGHLGVTQVLLDNGADVSIKDDEDKTALAAAVKANHGEIASLIIENGGDPNEPYIDEEDVPHNLLMDSIIVENSEFASLLISKGADVSHVDETGVSTVLQAAHRGLTEVVELLLNSKTSKADLNKANEDGITPIIAAASEGHEEVRNMMCY